MANLVLLKAEISVDTFRVYSTMSDKEVADSLNAVDRTLDREIINTWEILDGIDPGERSDLDDTAKVTASDRLLFDNWISAGTVNIQRPNTRAFFGALFTNADFPLSRANLLVIQTRDVSRATEINIGFVREGDVEYVRNN